MHYRKQRMQESWFTTWDSDANSDDRTLMVSQGTPEVLGQMLVDMAVDGLKERGKDP